MSTDNQSAFLQFLMQKNENLLNRRATRSEAVGFNKAFYDLYKQFLKQHEKDKENPTDQHTPFTALTENQRGNLLKRMGKLKGIIEKGKDLESSEKIEGNFKIDRVMDDESDVIGFNYYNTALGIPLTENQSTLNGDDKARPLNSEESLACMSYLRRLFMVNHAVDEQEKHGVMVVEREQAANFESAADFFAQMYLYQQSGLIETKDGKVTKAKIGIMPLFETTPDMKNAPRIVDDILSSDLGKSYYQARGKAEFMVGYSDGAKSGGNFASHIRVRDCEQAILDKFKNHPEFGPDFKVHFFRGPGRGKNRGGVGVYDQQYLLHPDDANKTPVNDQTVQGDLPIRMQLDSQFAERTMAEMTVSTMAGAIEARRPKTELEQNRAKSFDDAMRWIADHSEEAYRKNVFEKENECDDFLKSIIKNPDASSRAIKRANTAQKGIGPQRAITVEYATAIAGLTLHDYGLNSALTAFEESGVAVLDEKGKEVTGKKALEILAKDCPLFREEMKLATARQHDNNPVFTKEWLEKAKKTLPADRAAALESFLTNVHDEVSGLGEKCDSLVAGEKVVASKREDYSGEPFTHALSDMTQAIVAANDHLDLGSEEAKKLYFTLQDGISNKPTANLKTRIPGTDIEKAEQQLVA